MLATPMFNNQSTPNDHTTRWTVRIQCGSARLAIGTAEYDAKTDLWSFWDDRLRKTTYGSKEALVETLS